MTSKTLASLQWLLTILFVLIAAAIIVVLRIIFQYYPEYSSMFFRPAAAPVSAAAPEPISAIFIQSVTPYLPSSQTPTASASPTSIPSPTFTFTPTRTNTFTATPTDTSSPTATATLTPIPTDTPEIEIQPESRIPFDAQIEGVIGYPQQYTLDCESRSAVDLAAYFGVYIDQMTFQDSLPLSDDPEEGFVGAYWGIQGQLLPASYGVHAPPVAALLRSFGLPAYDQRSVDWTAVQAEIAAGRPVMAWVVGNTEPGWNSTYTASNGHTTIVAPREHTVIVTGYTPYSVTIVDGGMVYLRTVDQFLESWALLGNMVVMVK